MSKQPDKATETDTTVSSADPTTGEAGQDAQQERTEAETGGAVGATASEHTTAAQSEGVETPDQAGATPQAQDAPRLAELEARVAELEQENSELKERYLRKQADFENYRKRMQREKEEFGAYANKQLLLDLVQVIDDFERAIESAKDSRDFDSFYEGIALIEKQMTSMLERKWGLRRFDSEGEEFDPQKHEAVTADQNGEHHEPVVVEDYQKGYMLHDRVLRSAKVKVSMPGAEAGAGGEGADGSHDQNTQNEDGSGGADNRGSSDSNN